MANKGGLGRGLASLISSASEESSRGNDNTNELPISMIEPNPDQPRTDIDEERIAELSASIALHGVLMPILVRPVGDKYQIIAGERRWRGARLAGLEKVPVQIRNSGDTEALEIALIENLQREDLNAIEAAYGYKRLIDQHNLTHSTLAERVSKSRAAITNALRLLDLPEEIQALVYEGKMTAGHARAVLSLPDAESRMKLAEKIIEGGISVREAESLARLIEGGALPKSARPIAPKAYKTVARKLRRFLDAKVRVKQTKDRSKIEIEFENEDDLMRIFAIMTDVMTQYPKDAVDAEPDA